MKKKIIIGLLATIMAVSATACSTSGSSGSQSSQKTGAIETTVKATEEETTEGPTEPESSAIKPGNYVEHDNLKFSFQSAKTYDEIKQSDYYSDKADDGKEFLVLFFEVQNVSEEEEHLNMFYYKAYVDDYDVDMKTLLAEPDGYSLLSGDIAKGKKMKGYVAYEVDKGWKKFELTYTDGISKSSPTYEFVVTPDDIK